MPKTVHLSCQKTNSELGDSFLERKILACSTLIGTEKLLKMYSYATDYSF